MIETSGKLKKQSLRQWSNFKIKLKIEYNKVYYKLETSKPFYKLLQFRMSKELPYILNWHNCKETFNIVHHNKTKQICNFCWGDHVCLVISKMLSSEIWILPKPDVNMCICYECVSQYTNVNIKYIIFHSIVGILGVNISDIVNEYLCFE
jgi:hypothetical protein